MSLYTTPVKRFSFEGRPAFRFPYRTAWTRSDYDARFPSKALESVLFDDNHQSVLVSSPHGDICALGRSDGWARGNVDEIVLDPSTDYTLQCIFRCSTVYKALLNEGRFQVGENYTYKVV